MNALTTIFYSDADWREAVARGETNLGYAQWVAIQAVRPGPTKIPPVPTVWYMYPDNEDDIDTWQKGDPEPPSAGDRLVTRKMTELADGMRNESISSRAEVALYVPDLIKEVAAKHPEIHDTEPEWAVVDWVDTLCKERGWEPFGTRDVLG